MRIQNKRNEVSLFSRNVRHSLGGRLVANLILFAAFSMVIPSVSAAAELEIKQETYIHRMPVTKDIHARVFVISPSQDAGLSPNFKKESIAVSGTSYSNAQITNLLSIYFPIDSYAVDPQDRHRMIAQLRELKVRKNTPLVVYGYTCSKGSRGFNKWLSHQRAKAVAIVLKNEGYTVVEIEGRGAAHPVSVDHLSTNRRVEIFVLSQ